MSQQAVAIHRGGTPAEIAFAYGWGLAMNFRHRFRSIAIATAAAVCAGTAHAQTPYWLDAITIIATKTEERWIDTLAAVSTIRDEQLKQLQATRPADIFISTPGVWFQERPDDPATAINIRGLQDFGRVAVTIDGARQNFQRTGHNADGVFYIEPETIGGIDIVRGPVANIYGSGAIGGVVSFRTKDVEDILKPGEKWAVEAFGLGSTNIGGVGSLFAAVRVNPNVDLFFGGTYRDQGNYKDANGTVIPNTGSETWTGTAKATLRPADGHQIKLGFTNYDSKFVSGQPFIGTTPPFTGLQLSSLFDTHVVNQIATARWSYAKPEDRVFDWDGTVYWTSTATDQIKTGGLPPGFGGIGNIGDRRNFTIETVGFDLHNTSRFDTGGFRHALTYGVDGFQDQVTTTGFGTVFTPAGERTVSGGFVQLKSNYSTWLEVISAARYDNYRLEGGGLQTEGDRLSPKITVGVTPFAGFQPYVTYAEGYRAPAVTETLVTGLHPVIFAPFIFLPNPTLRPEVGKNKEAGINLKYDNVFMPGASFRAKANVFRNDVDDFIELRGLVNGQVGSGGITCTVPVFGCQQYQNIAEARLEGAEFESMYDTGGWFLGLAGSHVRGRNLVTGAPLAKIPPDFLTTTVGARFLERRLTIAVRWQAVAAKKREEIPNAPPTGPGAPQPLFPPTESYNLVNLYAAYEINPNATAAFSVENLLNENYSRYLTAFPNPTGSGAPIAFPQPGVTFKGSLRVRFAGG